MSHQTHTRTLGALVGLVLSIAAPATAHPGSAIVVDRLGQVWFLDTGDGLWKIDTHGALHHIGGARFHWMALDQDNRFHGVTLPADVTLVGTSPSLLIASDYPITVGQDGALYYPSRGPNGRLQILRLGPTGASTVLATLPATTTEGTPLQWVNGLTGGADGHLYYTENNAILRVTYDGQVQTVVSGLRIPGCRIIPGNSASDGLFFRGLSVDSAGVISVAASGCGAVLRITPDGRATKLVQLDAPWSPTAVAVFGTDLYVLEYLHTEREDRRAWIPRVRKISREGRSAIVARVER